MPTGKGPLRIAIEDFLSGFGFGVKFKDWIKSVLENWENEAIDTYSDFVGALGIESHLPPQIKPSALRAMTKHQIGLLVVVFPLVWNVLQQFSDLFLTPFMRPLNYLAEGLAHTKHTDANIILQGLRRKPELATQLHSILTTAGLDEISIAAIDSLIDQYLSPTDYQHLKLRGKMSQSEVNDKIKRMGFSDTDIQGLDELVKIIPGVSDLVLMAVREAFDDGVSAKFEHDQNLPAEFVEWTQKQGLDPEWAKRYWRSHWQLPSPNQVFEMLQRLRPGVSKNPITRDDVNTYLRTADYAPFWRDRLAEIAYQPITRVDVRRMYKTGVFDESKVKEAYLNLGYNDENAQALTEFTVAYEAEEETGVVRSSVVSAYGDGMIDRPTAEGMLSKGGYDTTTVAFYLDNVDFQETLRVNNIKLSNIHKRFVEGIIDETTVNNEINLLNLPAERTTAMLGLWLTERDNQTTQLTITQMETLLEQGIVQQSDYERIAKLRGYTPESIKWTLERIAGEASAKAQSDAEKAQADNERLQKSKSASQYQKDKAALDVDIAQARAEITDIDVALHGNVSEDDQILLLARKDELKQTISSLNVAKAQLRFDTQTALSNL